MNPAIWLVPEKKLRKMLAKINWKGPAVYKIVVSLLKKCNVSTKVRIPYIEKMVIVRKSFRTDFGGLGT